MMENPLSDEEGGKKWGPGAEHHFDLGVCAVDSNAWIQKLEYEWVCSYLFGFFFFLLNIVFVINQEMLWRKIAIFVSSYHPDSKMDWITGVWFLIMQGPAEQGQKSTVKMSKQK